jgi:hypothetical protein
VVGMAIMVMLSCGDGGGGEDDARDEDEAGRREEGVTTSSTTGVPTTTSSPPTTAPPSTIPAGPIGEIVSNGGWALLVHGVTDPYGPASNASGDRTVLVDVEVTHTGQGGTTSLTAFDNFQLTGGDVPSSGVDVQGMPSIAGPLTGGASRRGTMAFLVDAEVTTGMQLLFRPSLLDDPVVAVQVS